MQALFSKAQKIKCVVFDVDGVLTDGKLYFSEAGEIVKAFYVQDGVGIQLLKKSGIKVALISGRKSKIVEDRAKELGIDHIYQGSIDKLPIFNTLLTELKLRPEEVAYAGDDLPDIPPIQHAGLGIAVANAHPNVVKAAYWQTRATGGNGAAREICDLILLAQAQLSAS